MDRSANQAHPPPERLARLLAHAATALGAVAIVGTLAWAMHEDAQHALQRERMEQQQQRHTPQPTTEQRRHIAAQFVCGHGVAYQWVNANTVECLREAAVDASPVIAISGRR